MLKLIESAGVDLSSYSKEDIELIHKSTTDMFSLLAKDPSEDELFGLVLALVAVIKYGEEEDFKEVKEKSLGDLIEEMRKKYEKQV